MSGSSGATYLYGFARSVDTDTASVGVDGVAANDVRCAHDDAGASGRRLFFCFGGRDVLEDNNGSLCLSAD